MSCRDESILCAYPRCRTRVNTRGGQFCPFHHRMDSAAFSRGVDDRTEDIRAQLYKEQKGRCNYCGRKFPALLLVWDHLTPPDRGGSDAVGNLQLACQACNGKKDLRSDREFRADNKAALPQQPRAPARSAIRGGILRGMNFSRKRAGH
ncbi:MAG: HNH endonuclease [Chloroflexi bacterium]|nr:HNH endonuclease [Chloroflexota bacterium]